MNNQFENHTPIAIASEISEETLPRRSMIQRAGLFAGAAIASGLLTRVVRADDKDNKAAGDKPALAPADMTASAASAPIGSMSGPGGMPESAMIKETASPGAAETNDVAILNYALTLEYLESDFYSRVVQADDAQPFLRGRPKDIARVLARDESTHVQVVTDAIQKLGGTPVQKPQFQFPAEAFISEIAFLQISAQLEETGVSAYLGQGANVRRRDVLNFAASIYGNEARHTGLIRYLLGDVFAPRDMELPLSMDQVMTRVRPFMASS